MKVKYIGYGADAPEKTTLFGYTFYRGKTVDVAEDAFVEKLKGNPSFEIIENPETWPDELDIIDVEDAIDEALEELADELNEVIADAVDEIKDEVVDFPKPKKKGGRKKKK